LSTPHRLSSSGTKREKCFFLKQDASLCSLKCKITRLFLSTSTHSRLKILIHISSTWRQAAKGYSMGSRHQTCSRPLSSSRTSTLKTWTRPTRTCKRWKKWTKISSNCRWRTKECLKCRKRGRCTGVANSGSRSRSQISFYYKSSFSKERNSLGPRALRSISTCYRANVSS